MPPAVILRGKIPYPVRVTHFYDSVDDCSEAIQSMIRMNVACAVYSKPTDQQETVYALFREWLPDDYDELSEEAFSASALTEVMSFGPKPGMEAPQRQPNRNHGARNQ